MAHQDGHYTGTPLREGETLQPSGVARRPSPQNRGQGPVRRSQQADLYPEVTSRLSPTQLASLTPTQIANLAQLMGDLPADNLDQYEPATSTQREYTHGPLGELIFGNLGITAEDLRKAGLPAVPGLDKPIPFLESIAENVPLGEYLVPTTPRGLGTDAALTALTGGGGNLALTGRAIPGAVQRGPNPFTFGPRIADKLAEFLPAQTAENLLGGTGILSRAAQYLHPAKSIPGPKVISPVEQSARRHGLMPSGTAPSVTPTAYAPRTYNLASEAQDPAMSALGIARDQARAMRRRGSSPLQITVGRRRLEQIGQQMEDLRKRTSGVRRRQSRPPGTEGFDTDFLKSIGIKVD